MSKMLPMLNVKRNFAPKVSSQFLPLTGSRTSKALSMQRNKSTGAVVVMLAPLKRAVSLQMRVPSCHLPEVSTF